jgi:hypothetical protein
MLVRDTGIELVQTPRERDWLTSAHTLSSLVCREAAPVATHFANRRLFTEESTEFVDRGNSRCVLCQLYKTHLPRFGHECVIDLNYVAKKRRCATCYAAGAGEAIRPQNELLPSLLANWIDPVACGTQVGCVGERGGGT